MVLRQVEVAVVEQLEQLVTAMEEEEEEEVSGIWVTVKMRGSCLSLCVAVAEWAGGGEDKRLVSKLIRDSSGIGVENSEEEGEDNSADVEDIGLGTEDIEDVEDIGLETEDNSEDVEDIEDDDEDLDMHLEGGEATGHWRSSDSLFTVRSRGAWLSKGT